MTREDYSQGGITTNIASSSNWSRVGNNTPVLSNVGFENVPQGKYRYTYSLPKPEDQSTVAVNDVGANDRPFPVILVDGVVAKLHADNTSIEHDDGSTSPYFSTGTIDVPDGGKVQLGYVIEGGESEEFEFQNQVIENEQAADAIYGFFEIEKIDRPLIVIPGGIFEYEDTENDGEPRINRQQIFGNAIVNDQGIVRTITGSTAILGEQSVVFPVPFSKFLPVNVSLTPLNTSANTNRNITLRLVTNENFSLIVIAEGNNSAADAEVHWTATGLIPKESEVFPTLPPADPKPQIFNFQDQFGGFVLAFSNNTNSEREISVILDGVPYNTITNLNTGVTIKSEERVDGLYKHLLTFDDPFDPFANVTLNGNVPVNGSGDQTVIGFYAE